MRSSVTPSYSWARSYYLSAKCYFPKCSLLVSKRYRVYRKFVDNWCLVTASALGYEKRKNKQMPSYHKIMYTPKLHRCCSRPLWTKQPLEFIYTAFGDFFPKYRQIFGQSIRLQSYTQFLRLFPICTDKYSAWTYCPPYVSYICKRTLFGIDEKNTWFILDKIASVCPLNLQSIFLLSLARTCKFKAIVQTILYTRRCIIGGYF